MKQGRPILVTGVHRGGTTFCGRVLASAPGVGYIHEPFSKNYGIPEIAYWFQYVRAEQPDPAIREAVSNLLAGKGRFRRPRIHGQGACLQRHPVSTLLGSRAQRTYRRAVWDPRVHRFLIKDPFAAMASEFLHREFDAMVIVVLRHPAAFAASVKEATSRHWNNFNFDELVHQRELMEDHLNAVLRKWNLSGLDTIDIAALQWVCVYTVLAEFLRRNSQFVVVRHEDLAMEPVREFEKLFERLGLPFTPPIRRKIEKMTAPSNRSDTPPNTLMSLKRNSRAAVSRWKEKLTREEIDRVRMTAGELSSAFYSDW